MVKRRFRRIRSCLSAVVVLSLASVTALAAKTNPAPAWPPPPAEPRVVYVREISRPADIGSKPFVLSRLANWITGIGKESGALEKPFGLALDEAGKLLVTDTGAGVVCLLDIARKKWSRWEAVGKNRFKSPVSVARHEGITFVAESALGRVVAFDDKGRLKFTITEELERPSGIAIFAEKLFIADAQRHQIIVCDLKGRFISKFGRRGINPGEFNFPTHLSVDGRGQVYVTDSLNCRIQIFDANGQFLRTFGSAGDGPGFLSRPKGVAADRFGHVYVVDAVFDNVQVFDEEGRLLMNWGDAGQGAGQFWLPNAIAISPAGEIYVADSYNRRIQVFRYIGKE